MAKRTQKADEIFATALEIPAPADRAAYLRLACGDDEALRLDVESLLGVHERSATFLEQPAPDAEFTAPTLNGPADQPRAAIFSNMLAEKEGDRIGRFKLLEQIGEGGFGVVWMAEQEEPVRRRVALKIIKPGMDTKQALARFEAERQALALMDHPNIAKVHDGGATAHGRPYFVMELVRGIKITDYCDRHCLSTAERLHLFVQVCHAIQHAHQKGIIHRDIKPSNILVTLQDGAPVPKVIDFGIAKATDQPLTDKTVFTRFMQFMGTPAYMSPEQADFSSLDIDTRSDIYSLGVLLYELLTGATPFDSKELLAAGLDEVRRVIREKEAPRPSTRLSCLEQHDLTTVAQRRQTEPLMLIATVRGDLDWIVMKCLEKDRSRRYETANALATDLQRYLNEESVAARPASRFYRFQKLIRRNKTVFIAAAAFAASLIAGLSVSTTLFFREAKARKLATLEATKSRQVAQFLEEMLKGVGPSVARGRDTAMLREIVDKTTSRIGTDLKDQPEVEAQLRFTLADTYLELGQIPRAEAMHREGLAMRRKLFGEEHPAMAESLDRLAWVLMEEGKLVEAELHEREALKMRIKIFGDMGLAVGTSLNGLGTIFFEEGKPIEAEAAYRKALTIKRRCLGDENPSVAMLLNNLANSLSRQGRLVEAETVHREGLGMQRKLLGNDHPDVALSLLNLADLFALERKLGEAESSYRETISIARKVFSDYHPRLGAGLHSFGDVLSKQRKFAEAETAYREALAINRKRVGNEDASNIASLHNLADVLVHEGKLAEAESSYSEAILITRKAFGNERPQLAASLHNFGDLLSKENKLDEAALAYGEALKIKRKLLGTESPSTVASIHNLADTLRKAGKLAEAETLYAEELAIDRTRYTNNPAKLAVLCARQGQWKEAETNFARAIELEPGHHQPYPFLGLVLVQNTNLAAYREHCRRSVERFKTTANPVIAERIAKLCLILPGSGADLETVAKLADTAANVGTNHEWIGWFNFSKGLAEYRQGHFANAIEWAQKALAKAGEDLSRDVVTYIVLAMAQHQLKQTDESRANLAKGLQLADAKLPKLITGDLGDGWDDVVLAWTLMREAKLLVESDRITGKQ
ncbi:MAG TPA: tetratricopeptide repeat protein [Verrucomicrobiae bacterium]|nr:tetratricopeptide repeat protein [Verrucomicrobiae bacterium]